ncbi:MAG TPA: response regulator [Chloroflexi bacterium]|nr:response regulator [Chloroflexota bacterium]
MSKKRILYIEDNFENRLFVRRVLESMGCELLEAEDGMTGISMAQSESPDLILMDIGLPGMDGLEATIRIRQDQEIKDIPIIALTANAMKGDAERCLAAGCDIYLTKPIGVSDLKDKVLGFLD